MESEGLLLSMEPPPRKPFLGGYRHKDTRVEYHHATTQTDLEEKPQKDFSSKLKKRGSVWSVLLPYNAIG